MSMTRLPLPSPSLRRTVIIQSRLARRIALTVCMRLVPFSVRAQDAYPNRAIKIIAPVGAGSVADLVPRVIGNNSKQN